ncbi:penicillin acylase family protein [Ornithinibacillus sp. L9]|uniref:Penicillin acylase family protein n=1 Tax=Ornithinibacillus caprae TaxID=2678566 RepID=A0A6N8FPS6_9BACI|nr:penicillin acylase family protein [Ornithinibacillus caprae]MUK90177.1 penicillin acylase family protein [Ornithinibacillus caprae]
MLIITITAFLFVNGYINKSLPKIEGTITLPMLEDEVLVITDEHGIPHIKATSDHDLYIAQGYLQAQNRMFQMELSRRQASGTLSEVVGEAAVNQDKYFRTLGLRRAAEKSYDIYSEENKQVLEWFANGVNAYMEEAIDTNSLPVEFLLMGANPEPWTPIDSLTIGKFMAFDLGGNWERQAFNYDALNRFDEEKAYELFPNYPESKPTIIGEDEIDIAASFEHAVIPHAFNGSNNWVVSGEKTDSGLPLLADDPHLGLATPSIWLQMHLETDDMNVSGVIFAGVPGIILGHNDQIAWGVTNTGPDVQQLYIEKRNPDNPNEYLYEEQWEEATIIDEPIRVKDGETIDYQVVETRNGPIVSEFAEDSGKNTVLSLRWTALDPTTELEAILEINRASNWDEFEKGLEKFLVPAQNFVFASTDGTIAYKANGLIPIYQEGEDALLPLPGWEAEHEWQGYIPFDELPRVVNPDKGFIATANNKIIGEDYPYHISNVWAQPYRFERIAEVLEDTDRLTVEDMQALQMDITNLQAREFVPLFIETLKDVELGSNEERALASLEEWNFMDHVDFEQPLIFHHWLDEMEAILYHDEIPESVMGLFGSRGQTTDELLRKAIKGETSIWIEENGGIESVLKDSLENTIRKLSESYGEDVTTWRWGDFHHVHFDHPLSGIHPVLAYFFNREDPLPVGGSAVTPMAAAYNANTGEVNHGASWRFVIDTSDMNVGYHIVGPGQEGHFRSEWYHDQLDNWVHGEYHVTTLNPEEGKTLQLVPE